MVFATMNGIYLISIKPLDSNHANRIEIFNEICIIACSHIVNVFLNAAVPIDFRDNLGWALMAVAGFNIIVNLGITGYGSILDIYNDRKSKREKEKFE